LHGPFRGSVDVTHEFPLSIESEANEDIYIYEEIYANLEASQ
jgi:hypothetical protein